jgi:hypothetical protein
MVVKRKTSRRELSPEQRSEIWGRWSAGESIPSLIRRFKRPRSTITSLLQRTKIQPVPTFKNKPRPGPKKKTTNRQDRALVRHANNNPRETLFALCTPSKSGKKLGRNTVRKVLKSYGKAKRRPRKKPWLRPENQTKRLKWSKEEKKGKRDWDTVCWSDEVTFVVGEDGTVFYVTRAPGEEHLPKNLKPTFKSGRTTLGVWSCYCGNEMGPLVVIPKGGTMTAKRYLETVKKHFLPFYRRMKRKYGPEVVMQEDNAPWHKAKIVTAYLNKQKVKRLRWPPQSPDLSPIENLWKQIKDILSKMRHKIKNIEQMETVLNEVWPTIKGETLLKLNASMYKRLAQCIKNKGGATKY